DTCAAAAGSVAGAASIDCSVSIFPGATTDSGLEVSSTGFTGFAVSKSIATEASLSFSVSDDACFTGSTDSSSRGSTDSVCTGSTDSCFTGSTGSCFTGSTGSCFTGSTDSCCTSSGDTCSATSDDGDMKMRKDTKGKGCHYSTPYRKH
ncbi:hypothetical protein QQP08_001698, partial [Theobroma cacao]